MFIRSLVFCLFFSLLGGLVGAAPPSLVLPKEVVAHPGRLASIEIRWQGDDIRWEVLSSELDVFREFNPDAQTIRLRIIAYSPGKHKIVAVAVGDGKLTPIEICTVEVKGKVDPQPPAPTPEPPGPTPDPSPPQADKVWLVVIEERNERTPDTAQVLTDAVFWKGLEKRGHRWRIFDKDQPVVKELGYDKLAEKSGLPALIMTSATGAVLNIRKLPSSAEGINAALKEVSPK
jgi:hypothetical protein